MGFDPQHLRSLLDQLTLEEKVALVSGASFWTTAPIERIGLRAMVLSDGPSGVRGPVWDERSPSLSLPSGTALAASWDPELAYRYGQIAAAEARRKGVDIVLGPTINLHRSPFGGRHFEAFSEDPLLSGVLAAAYVCGMQDSGVAATPKHYVANDSETNRFTVDVRVDARALREVYLLPFEYAVEAGAWAIMSSYNAVDGVTMTENDLLHAPLNTEWEFDGVVLSDWTAVRSLAAASADNDLAMPGPTAAWGAALVEAVSDGRVAESDVDRKVMRLLVLAERVGALAGSTPKQPIEVDGHAFAREAAIEGTVLLANRAELPWAAESLGSIAIIGQHATLPRIQGGGSATVIPDRVITPLDGVRARLPHADIRYELGAVVEEGVTALPIERLDNPHTGEPGLRVTFRDAAGVAYFTEDRQSAALVWFDGDTPLERARTIVIETLFRPEADGSIQLGFASSKAGRIRIDGVLVLDERPELPDDPAVALLAPSSVTAPVPVRADVPLTIHAEFRIDADDELPGAAAITVGLAPSPVDPAELIARAVAVARDADVALVVVGTSAAVESEGFDRTSLNLPGHQDELVRAVAAVNPRTVVVINAGSPVLLPWRNEVAAVLLGYFGGQEMGSAIADVVFGHAEPGGRLTSTWPVATSDVPVLDVVPTDGVLDYVEGIQIGYRAWLASTKEPAFPFGWGLGYTTWDLDIVTTEGGLVADDLAVVLEVANTGDRAGKSVVQVYAERPDSALERPVRWLVASTVVRLEAGDATAVRIPLRARAFAHWDVDAAGWAVEPGAFVLRVGTSIADLPVTLEVPDRSGASV
jgi:beta-glucosidase